MNKKYIDELKKIEYYRDIVANNIIRQSSFPTEDKINKELDKINMKLSIFKHYNIKELEKFNTKEFNHSLQSLYEDLRILYEILYKDAYNNYVNLKELIDTKLTELEKLATKHAYKTRLETLATTLGNTVYFQTSGYNIDQNNTFVSIDLGDIEYTKGSTIACLFNSVDVKDENIIFRIGKDNLTPYSLNKDTIKIKGEPNINFTSFTKVGDFTKTKATKIDLDVLDKLDSQFFIFNGYNTVINNNSLIYKHEDLPFTVEDKEGKIEFYIVNATYANFEFSTKPSNVSFTDNKITSPKAVEKVVIEYNDKDFSFNCHTDGYIYAKRKRGVIKDDNLYYPEYIIDKEFLIEEHTLSEKIKLPTKVILNNVMQDIPLKIEMIAIKELPSMVEVIK